MGLLDIFFGGGDKGSERQLQKFEKKITNMYTQAPERQFALQELRDIGTTEAVWVMLQRYNENNPNTTVDIDEKELVFDFLVRLARSGDADVIGQVKRYVLTKDVKVNWPMKILNELLSEEDYVAFMVEVLATCDTAYQRTVEKKQELVLRATELDDPALAEQIARFLSDDNETIRFLAVDAAFNQSRGDLVAAALYERLLIEDSNRVLQKLMPNLIGRQDMAIPEHLRPDVEAKLPADLGIHKQGYIYRRRQ